MKLKKLHEDKFLSIEFNEDKKQLKVTLKSHKNRLNDKILLIKFKTVLSNIQKFEPKKILIDLSRFNFLLDTNFQDFVSSTRLNLKNNHKIETEILLPNDEFVRMSIIQMFEILERKVALKLKYLTKAN